MNTRAHKYRSMWLGLILLILLGCWFYIYSVADSKHKPAHEYAIDLYGATDVRNAARVWFLKRGETDVVPALIRSLRYFPEDASQTLYVLKSLTNQELGNRWFDWFIWMEENPTESLPNNEIFLETIFGRIDPQFKVFFYPNIERRIRLDEITWGGVRKDGIPALTNPKLIDADEATYLRENDLVFGISINGDVRAYPYRIMDWHEMLNDTIGGMPVSLAYCTLCGSGILYKTARMQNQPPFVFGSSGFLYRSNKLMYDQDTHSLWNQFSGKPVVGPLANGNIELQVLPLVTTTWSDWRNQHPNTKVLDLDTGYDRDYAPGTAYGAYFGSDELMFPAFLNDDSLQQKERVFGLRISGAHKAWPLKHFETTKLINDRVGIIPVVLIGNASTSTVRAYRSEGKQFRLTNKNKLMAEDVEWKITETDLIGPNDERLPRLPGHIAYWFAWSGYFPDTLSQESENKN